MLYTGLIIFKRQAIYKATAQNLFYNLCYNCTGTPVWHLYIK
jgi:hypothetical protein